MTLPVQAISFNPAPVAPIQPVLSPLPQAASQAVPETFGAYLNEALKSVNKMGLDADQSIVDWRAGKIENMHEVSLALARADMAIRLLVQVRNKGLDAYQEIMRMPI